MTVLDLVEQVLTNVILPAALTTAAGVLTNFLMKKVGIANAEKITQEISTHKTMALDAVSLVHQLFPNLNPYDKFNSACQRLSVIANTYGIKLTPDQIHNLVVLAGQEFKDAFVADVKQHMDPPNLTTVLSIKSQADEQFKITSPKASPQVVWDDTSKRS